MFADVLEHGAIMLLRLVGWSLAAFTIGKLAGEVLGKRNFRTYVQDMFD